MCTQKLTNSQLHLSRRAEERRSNENSRTVMLRRSGAGHQSVDSVLREQRGYASMVWRICAKERSVAYQEQSLQPATIRKQSH